MARSKVKSRSHHDAAHLHPLTNVSTKYQLPTPYSFRDIARTRFYRSRSLRQGQRSNQGQIMTLHNYTLWRTITYKKSTLESSGNGEQWTLTALSRLPVCIMAREFKIFETNLKFEEIIKFISYFCGFYCIYDQKCHVLF